MESSLMNSPGLWVSCSFMILVIVFQSILYFRLGKKSAIELGIPKKTIILVKRWQMCLHPVF